MPDIWIPGDDHFYNEHLSGKFTQAMAIDDSFILLDARRHMGFDDSPTSSQTTIQEKGVPAPMKEGKQAPTESKTSGIVRFADVTRGG
jgi:hypothetical protein